MDEIFQWIGVAASIGCVSFVLALTPVMDAIQWPFSTVKACIVRKMIDRAKHGRRGMRYRLGVTLLLPYLIARDHEVRAAIAEIDADEAPDPWDVARRDRLTGVRVELRTWVRLNAGRSE